MSVTLDTSATDPERITGKLLNQQWGVGAKHALYRADGKWYHHLNDFPGALFDESGYLLFPTREAYLTSPYLRHSADLHVPAGIATVPEYVRVAPDEPDDEGANSDAASLPYDVSSELDIRYETNTVFEWIRRLDRNRLIVDPEFQRNLVWTSQQKSEFIESILLGIPLPPIYVNQDANGVYTVVDGLQRTTTISEFVKDRFALSKLPVLEKLSGSAFSSLSPAFQSRIEDRSFQVYVIKPSVPIKMVYDIFHRINKGGTQLNRQEIRNCLYIGPATRLLARLAIEECFQRATDGGIPPTRMRDREAILHYLAFTAFNFRDLYRNDMDGYLVLALEEINRMEPSHIERLVEGFIRVMNLTFRFFGNTNFRVPTSQMRGRINVAVLESVSLFFHQKDDAFLLRHREHIRSNYKILLTDPAYLEAVSSSTASTKRVITRFDTAETILGNVE